MGDADYIQRALSLLKELDLSEEELAEPLVSRTMIQRIPREAEKRDQALPNLQKNVLVKFSRLIRVGDEMVAMVGPGSQISVQLNNEGQLMNLSKVWRDADSESAKRQKWLPVKPYETALKEARECLDHQALYQLASVEFGYEAKAGNVYQTEAHPVYHFAFALEDQEKADLPPRMIQIAGF